MRNLFTAFIFMLCLFMAAVPATKAEVLSAPTNFRSQIEDCATSIFGTTCTVSLSWTGVSGATGYNLYYGFSSGNYAGFLDVGNVTSLTYPSIVEGIYYLALTSYDSGWVESGYSNEVVLDVGSGGDDDDDDNGNYAPNSFAKGDVLTIHQEDGDDDDEVFTIGAGNTASKVGGYLGDTEFTGTYTYDKTETTTALFTADLNGSDYYSIELTFTSASSGTAEEKIYKSQGGELIASESATFTYTTSHYAACEDVSGRWSFLMVGDLDCDEWGAMTIVPTITQSGCVITDFSWNSLTGAVDGNDVSINGCYDDNGGVNCLEMNLKVSGDDMDGSGSWVWSGKGEQGCSGSVTITGAKL